MPIRNSQPAIFLPVGLSDAVDQSSAFPGSCQIISNLVFDRDNRGAIVARPGVTQQTNFPGFNQSGVISVAFVAGTLIYGMISSTTFSGKDEPFCYDTVAAAFITVSGVTGANLPNTQPVTGPWVPPTMDANGIFIAVTHPGFSGGNAFGWFDVTNLAAPVWNAGNTTVNALPSRPNWVAQFFGRLYFGISNAVYFTDSLALSISNTNFAAVLTLGDKSSSTGAAGLPMSQTSGAVLQSLVVFKQGSIWQISGDIATTASPLTLSRIADSVGCVAPRTIQSTPLGIYFIGTDGPRFISLTGLVSYLQTHGQTPPDIVAPFLTATEPTRMVGIYCNSVYRVSFDGNNTIWNSTYAAQDYWYDLTFSRWNGPHTFNYHCGVGVNNVFYLFSNNSPGKMFRSEVIATTSSVYQDVGTNMLCEMVSSAVEGTPMTVSAVVESTIELGGAGIGSVYYISLYDEENNNLAPATISLYEINPLWGSVKWGQFKWRSSVTSIQVFTIPWANPAVFKSMVVNVRVLASKGISIKAFWARIQTLGYTNI